MNKDRKQEVKELEEISKKLRNNILDMVYNAKSGHIGGSFSIIDILNVIYTRQIKKKKNEKEEDIVVLSKGHASPALYSVLYEIGKIDSITGFRNINTILEGHPTPKINGVQIATGSLGQGLSSAIGMGLVDKLENRNRKIYVIIGDGEMQEGQVYEALLSLSKYILKNITVIIDCNNLQIDGHVTEIKNIYPLKKRLKSYNFEILEINGHNFNQIIDVLDKETELPKIVLAKTVKGKGVSFMENEKSWHGKAPTQVEYEKAKLELK